jgi:D-sedoheptulose 7-phosphate isomerase
MRTPRRAGPELKRIRTDTLVGMGFSHMVALFIILATAATLHASGVTNIESASQAAEALRPIAGNLAFALFAVGIIGTGLLAVPDCQHIAGEFVGRFRAERKALAAIAFSTDTSVITCIGNDYSFDDIFSRQAQALIKSGDILWAFSTSGKSKNIIKAVNAAKGKGATIISFTGKAESELEKISDICLCAATNYTSTSQEIHMLAYHIVCDLIDDVFVKNSSI